MIKTGLRIEDRGLRARIEKPGIIVAERKGGGEPDFSRSSLLAPRSCQRGFSLISAIFLLVVIAALGTFAVTMSTTQHQSQTMDVMGARGYQAALAGIEWAAFNVIQQPVSSPAAWAGCTAGTEVTVAGTLAPFSPVTVNCTAVSAVDWVVVSSAVQGVGTVWSYDVSAVAVTGGAAGQANYVEQVARAKMVR